MILVGDRGTLTSARIREDLKAEEQLHAFERLPGCRKTSDRVVNSSEISLLFSAAAFPRPLVQNVADSRRFVLRRLPTANENGCGCRIITRSVAAFCRAAQICSSKFCRPTKICGCDRAILLS